ncbi:MAG: tetratricopeptide repeat protein [Rubripirellula sp.]
MTRFAPTSFCSFALACILIISVGLSVGCSDDRDTVRTIQAQRQAKMQAESQQDNLGEAFSLLNRLVELNPEKARRQIAYNLNRWAESKSISSGDVPAIVGTVSNVLPLEVATERITRTTFQPTDVDHLRDAFLTRKIIEWVDQERSDDPLLADWLLEMETKLGETDAAKLRTATRLFDWTIRNIAYEPKVLTDGAPQAPSFSLGMEFRGEGYRQTDFNTVWRGFGDSLQRSGLFTLLCRQASIPAFMLAIQSTDTGALEPWCVGVKIADEIYLFEFELATYIPGPGQVGIATLAQARSDAAILRRMNVPGFFDYWRSKGDVQQCIALLNLVPEAISPRMQLLQSGLTGDRRMNTYVDVDALQEEIDSVAGIAGVRMWDVPLLAEQYEKELKKAVERDPLIMLWYVSRYAMLDDEKGPLAMARWRHLRGQFNDDDDEDTQGARTLYLAQRAPEFEIEDLRIDVDLQKAYNVRRDLGTTPEQYEMQLQQTQAMIRLGKRTATYWISLIQYDDQRYDTAVNWFTKRVLTDEQISFWEPSARYNLARASERVGELERAVELYKTDGDPQEHGNRIRARLLGRDDKEADPDGDAETPEEELPAESSTQAESSAQAEADTSAQAEADTSAPVETKPEAGQASEANDPAGESN